MRFSVNRRPRVRRLGATAVEFALVAQMFFFLMLAAVDIIGMMNAYSTLQWAVTTGARSVMADPSRTTAQVQTTSQNAANTAGYTTAVGTAFVVTQAACGTLQCMNITGAFTYRFVASAAFCSNSNGATCQVNLTESVVAPIVPNN